MGEEKRRSGRLLAGFRGKNGTEELNHQPHLQQRPQRAVGLLEEQDGRGGDQEGYFDLTSLSLN